MGWTLATPEPTTQIVKVWATGSMTRTMNLFAAELVEIATCVSVRVLPCESRACVAVCS